MRSAPCLLLIALAVAVALVACGGGNQKAGVIETVEELQAAVNAGDPAAAYDAFAAEECRAIAGRQEFVTNFETFPYEIASLSVRDDMQIDGGRAYLIVTASFAFETGEPESATFFETFVEEDDGWKDADCLAGGLGGNFDSPGDLGGR